MFTYIVSGMKRTGTSMMMECLGKGGLEICWDESRNKAIHLEYPNNPNANFYELELPKVVWMPLAPYGGKCIKAMGTIFLNRDGGPFKVVYMMRHPSARATSLWHACGEMNGASYDDRIRTKNIKALSESDEVDTLSLLDYDNVLKNPQEAFRSLQADGWPIDPEKAASGVNPKLKHY